MLLISYLYQWNKVGMAENTLPLEGLVIDCGSKFACNCMGRLWLWRRSEDAFNPFNKMKVVKKGSMAGTVCFNLKTKAGFGFFFLMGHCGHSCNFINHNDTLYWYCFFHLNISEDFTNRNFWISYKIFYYKTCDFIFILQSALLPERMRKRAQGRGPCDAPPLENP